MKIIIPFQNYKKYPLTQKFGAPYLYRGMVVTHKGVDWGIPPYTDILAPFDAVVTRVESTRDYGYGRTVYLKAEDNVLGKVEALLAHNETILAKVGDKVKRGNIIALSGRTGYWRGKNGYHTHFGLKINGIWKDPLLYLSQVKDENQKTLFEEKDDESMLRSFLGDYVVEKGDTLWRISSLFYKTGGHYVEIFNANQDILKDPNKIKPGQRLRIPYLKNKGI